MATTLHHTGRHLVLEERVAAGVILLHRPLGVVGQEPQEELVQRVPRLDLHRHGDKERHKKQNPACEGDHFFCRQAFLVFWELGGSAAVRQEAHHRGDGAPHHDEQIE